MTDMYICKLPNVTPDQRARVEARLDSIGCYLVPSADGPVVAADKSRDGQGAATQDLIRAAELAVDEALADD
jgi:hypothetical protein